MAATAQNPPRTLNVQRFAEARRPEIQSLHSLVSTRLSGRFRLRRSDRRRTTSHLRHPKRRRPSASTTSSSTARDSASDGPDIDADQNREKKKLKPLQVFLKKLEKRKQGKKGKDPVFEVCRRERRRRELTSNPELGFVVAGDGTKRLRTHVWHAKRFEMVKRWGFYLPLGIQGRGRGSRAVLRLLQNGALVHDASYYLPIQLEGPQDCIMSVLRMVLIPSPPGVSQMSSENLSHKVLQGAFHQDAMLYHIGSSASHLVAPVTYMWDHTKSEKVESENSSDSESGISSVRKLWVWIHAAAFHEGCNALRTACEKQQIHGNAVTVSCVPQEGRLARLDVMGAKASQLLNKILRPVVTSDKANKWHLVPCTTTSIAQIEKLPPGAILPLRVKDPRLISSEISSEFDEGAMNFDNMELWDSLCKIDPPVPENILCKEKNKRRLNSLFLEPTSQEAPAGEKKEGFSRSCPVILLKHAHEATCLGWSIILPLSWVKPFWFSMVSSGAHAIGLRERRWVAWKNNVPCFPHDFPDTEAYKSLLADQGALFDASAQLRPHTMRPQKIPMPPPWDCLVASSHHICKNIMQCKPPSLDIHVPRTTEALKECVEKLDGGDSISTGDLKVMDGGREKGLVCLVRVLIRAFKEGSFEDGAVVCAPCIDDLSGWNSRSEKEVEEYQEKWQLEITQSSVESYFMQLESDGWAIQVPEDPVKLKSFRWPVGFITTGIVHACNDRVAMAFCDIRILAALRRQQYFQTQIKRPEIFVLVRNMKSTSYRRAIATIVLEQQREDLHFL